MSVLTDTFTSIANAIRTVMGGSSTYKPSDMPTAISSFKYLPTATTAAASDLISGKTGYSNSGSLVTGNVVKYIKSTYRFSSFLGGAACWAPAETTSDCSYLLVMEPGSTQGTSKVVYAYDKNYTKSTAADASVNGAPAKCHGKIGKYTIFAGGRGSDVHPGDRLYRGSAGGA